MYSTLANVKNVLCKYQNCFCRGLLVKPHWWLFYRREPKDYVKFSGTSSITRRMKALSIKWWRTALHRLVSDFPKKKSELAYFTTNSKNAFEFICRPIRLWRGRL